MDFLILGKIQILRKAMKKLSIFFQSFFRLFIIAKYHSKLSQMKAYPSLFLGHN